MSDKKIKFYLPDFYYQYQLNQFVITLLLEHPEYFRDNIEIGAVYGSFPCAIWNGGRLMHGIADIGNIKNTISGFNRLNIPVRFTFTNCLIDENLVHDTYCNLIMNCANNGMNEVLVNSHILEEYLRNKYPDFKYIMSTTRCERDIDAINKACDNYHLVVPDFRDNTNFNYLNKLKNKDKIELLINAYCDPDCKIRSQHYEQLSKDQLNYRKYTTFVECNAMGRSFFEALPLPTVIKADDLYTKYVDMGFSNFKIEGRTIHTANVIESYVYYLVKPEYKDMVRYMMIRHCWN